MAGLSEAASPQQFNVIDTNQDEENGSNTTVTAPSTVLALQHALDEQDPTPVVQRNTRRSSRQNSSGGVHPATREMGEATTHARKRSVSTRGITGTPTNSEATWVTLSSGLRRSVSDIQAHIDRNNRRRAKESPYEEMMERFQIRKLQRTTSTIEVGLENLLGGARLDIAGATSSAHTALTPRTQLQEHQLLTRRSARNVSEYPSINDVGNRNSSFLHLSEAASSTTPLGAGRPPLESGTSSLHLTEQSNLVYGTIGQPPHLSSQWRYALSYIASALHRLSRPVSPFSKVSQIRYAVTLIATVVYVLWLPLELAFHNDHLLSSADTVIRVLLLLDIVFTLHTGYMTETGKIVTSHWHIFSHYMKTRFILDALISVPLLIHSNNAIPGEGVLTDTAAQNLFASLSVIVGSIVLAVMFGHVAILVSNFNANITSYQRKMEEVFAMTAKLQLPAPLRERIREYYEHLWHEYECLDGEIVQFSKELSHTLGLEVVLFKYMEVVMHVPFWKDCTPDFQKQLMLRLDVRVYLPNDFIMREGEVDDEFYMVNRGYCEICRDKTGFERVTTSTIATGRSSGDGLSFGRRNSGGMGARRRSITINADHPDDGCRQSAYELDAAQRRYYRSGGPGGKGREVLISRGQAFGDMALLMNCQRAANVRAVTHVEMCVLARDDFQNVLGRYPEDCHRVVVDMLATYMQSYELCKSRCPMLEIVRKIYSPETIAEACAKAGGHTPLLPAVLTARQAAERIYTAINIEANDGTLKFGVGVNIRDQLIDLRERLRGKRKKEQQSRASFVVSPTSSSHGTPNRNNQQRVTDFSEVRNDNAETTEPVESIPQNPEFHESMQLTS
ncbi:unnamed protein product [Phytophthora fragariaefolia]|uniref:Unnamed protein product n=1 Tax=Phytophthora fragariaefolia TaxID=1490495 RepID=A0A9W6YK99_9STRA|nr:unnamed protein product [Phytophthora fragariaefolia]